MAVAVQDLRDLVALHSGDSPLRVERWGRVGPDGIRISLPLTHEVLAMLVGAQRPSVTVAVKRLSAAGLLQRIGRRRWLLTHLAIERLAEPESLDIDDGGVAQETAVLTRRHLGRPRTTAGRLSA